jgi:hypothetical protein
MNTEIDPFDPANLQVPDDMLQPPNGDSDQRLVWNRVIGKFVDSKDASVARNPKFKYVRLPVEGLGKLAVSEQCIALLILLRLEELWFTQFKQRA